MVLTYPLTTACLVVGCVAAAASADVTFFASFEHGLDADEAAGRRSIYTLGSTQAIDAGRRGAALWVPPLDTARFETVGNFPVTEGTLDLWVHPRPAGLERVGLSPGDQQTIWMAGVTRYPHFLQLRLERQKSAATGEEASWQIAVLAANGEKASQPIVSAEFPNWPAGGWRHIALAWQQPSSLKLYVNGELVGESSSAPLPSVQASDLKDMYLGSNVTQSAFSQHLEHLDGLIDEVRIQDRFDAVQSVPVDFPEVAKRLVMEARTASGVGPAWVGPQRFRVLVQVPASRGAWINTPTGIELDFDDLLGRVGAGDEKLARASLRLVRYDAGTGEPIAWDGSAADDVKYYQPFTLGDGFERRDQGLVRWSREGVDEAIYGIYFDSDEHADTPAPKHVPMVGNGDRLRIGRADETGDLMLGAWSVLGAHDFDGDGDLDLWANSGFLVRSNQHLRNGQYYLENQGRDEAGRPLFATPRLIPGGYGNFPFGVFRAGSAPDFVDVNGDGRVDLFHAGEMGQAWAELSWAGDRPAIGRWHLLDLGVGEKYAKLPPATYIDWDGDGTREMFAGGYVYPNLGSDHAPRFDFKRREQLMVDGKPIDTSLISGQRFLATDWDGDGDLDVIVGGVLHWVLYFENVGSRTSPRLTARGVLKTVDGEDLFMPGALIRPLFVDLDGDGDKDLVWGNENGHVGFNENVASPGEAPKLLQTVFAQQPEPVLDSGTITVPVMTDWDHDGDLDIITGASDEYLLFYENIGTQRLPEWKAGVPLTAGGEVINLEPGYDGSVQGRYEAHWGYTNPDIADWDGDGLDDLLVSGTRGEHLFFRNTGTATKPTLAPGVKLQVAWGEGGQKAPAWVPFTPAPGTLVTVWRSRPVATDWDGDGLTDYIALDHEGELALYRRQRTADGSLELLPGERCFDWDRGTSNFMIWNRKPDAKDGGSGRTVLNLVDWDGDGDRDLITDGLNARLFENVTDDERPRFEDRGDLVDERLVNHNSAPEVADWDNDGKPDLFVGTEDGAIYYFHRSYIERDAPLGETIAIERRGEGSAR